MKCEKKKVSLEKIEKILGCVSCYGCELSVHVVVVFIIHIGGPHMIGKECGGM